MYLKVTEEKDGEYYHMRGRVVTQKYEDSAYQPYGVDDSYSDGLLWSGLQASCQGDRSTRNATERPSAVYGFDVEYYDMHRLDLRTVRRMEKTLTKLERGLAKLTEARGYVRSYGEYLGRVAEALGCTGMVFLRGERSRQITGQRWDWMSVGDGVNRANNLIHQWQEDGKPQAPAAEEVAS